MLHLNRRLSLYGIIASFGLAASLPAQSADFSATGFGSLFYGQALNSALMPITFNDHSPDFTSFSLVGTDLNLKLGDEWSAAAELIATGKPGLQTNFNNFAQWAYLAYAPMPGMSIKLGRQRYAVWTASEYINTHFLLPFRELPGIVLRSAPFNSFDGVSISQEFAFNNDLKMNIQVFGGNPLTDIPLASTQSITNRNALGARINFEGDGWRVRGQVTRYHTVAVGYAPSTVSANRQNASVGYRFDKYNIVSWGEYMIAYSHDGTPLPSGTYLQSSRAGYVLVGYQLNKILPRYTFASANQNLGLTAFVGSATTHTFGVNIQASPKVLVKAEYELNVVSNPNTGGAYVTQPVGSTATSGSAIYLGADFLI